MNWFARLRLRFMDFYTRLKMFLEMTDEEERLYYLNLQEQQDARFVNWLYWPKGNAKRAP